MRKNKIIALLSAFVLSLALVVVPAHAEEESTYITIDTYTETFKPTSETDAELTIDVTATVGEDGYVYIIKSLADMAPSGTITGENIDTTLEEYTEGTISYYRVKAIDPTQSATVKATFTVPGLYGISKADTNGGSNFEFTYKFTNNLSSKIGKYSVYAYAPEGNEIVKVSAPSAYADYILGEEDGVRYAGLSKGLASAANTTLTFTYNTPTSTMVNMIVWVVCLGIGGFVFVDRLKKAKAEQE